MHEMAICESLIQIIEDQVRLGDHGKVKTVFLEIGMLAGVEVEALRFCFDAVASGTVAEGATLEINQPPGSAWCLDCACQVNIRQLFDSCPICGGSALQMTGGKELKITQLEVE